MQLEQVRKQLIESFKSGIFPSPTEFTEPQIEAIASMPGIDSKGTFADAQMERSLMYKYDLNADRGDNTWPEFAAALRVEKLMHLDYINSTQAYTRMVYRLVAQSEALNAVGKYVGNENGRPRPD